MVLLQDEAKTNVLPIWVGSAEGTAIRMALEGMIPPRPLSHDLIRNLTEHLGLKVSKVVVTDVRNNTYYASIYLSSKQSDVTVDSRPSDALALALRMDCPIFVDEAVLKNSKISSAFSERNTNEQLRSWLEGLSDDDLGRYKM